MIELSLNLNMEKALYAKAQEEGLSVHTYLRKLLRDNL